MAKVSEALAAGPLAVLATSVQFPTALIATTPFALPTAHPPVALNDSFAPLVALAPTVNGRSPQCFVATAPTNATVTAALVGEGAVDGIIDGSLEDEGTDGGEPGGLADLVSAVGDSEAGEQPKPRTTTSPRTTSRTAWGPCNCPRNGSSGAKNGLVRTARTVPLTGISPPPGMVLYRSKTYVPERVSFDYPQPRNRLFDIEFLRLRMCAPASRIGRHRAHVAGPWPPPQGRPLRRLGSPSRATAERISLRTRASRPWRLARGSRSQRHGSLQFPTGGSRIARPPARRCDLRHVHSSPTDGRSPLRQGRQHP